MELTPREHTELKRLLNALLTTGHAGIFKYEICLTILSKLQKEDV